MLWDCAPCQTFAIIKPDAFGKPWVETVLEKNDADEEEPVVDEDGVEQPRAPREAWKSVTNVRAPDMGIEILKRIEQAGFQIVKRKTMQLTRKVRGLANITVGAVRALITGIARHCCSVLALGVLYSARIRTLRAYALVCPWNFVPFIVSPHDVSARWL